MPEFPRDSGAFVIHNSIRTAGRKKEDLVHNTLPLLTYFLPSL